MNKTLKLLRAGFESSSETTQEFLAFVRTFKKEFGAELKAIGASNIEYHRGHFEVTGFYTVGKQPWYFSLHDVRFFPDEQIMYRTAKDYKDYSGGSNVYATIKTGMAKEMHRT